MSSFKSQLFVVCCILAVSSIHCQTNSSNSSSTPTASSSDVKRATMLCCPKSYVFDPKTLSCVCPADLPYLTLDSVCVACNSPAVWNPTTKQCFTCGQGLILNSTTLTCMCPAATPYYAKNGSCVACPRPNFWNCETKSC